jgi:hypothetical protein
MIGKYFGTEANPPTIPVAYLDLAGSDEQSYRGEIKRNTRQLALRNLKKATKNGFYVKRFARDLFVPDICEINTSKEVRCGKPMAASYRRSVEELGGYPEGWVEYEAPLCPRHYDMWWGCFIPETGHVQGDVNTGEKLVAYVRLRRLGELAYYGQILGHGDYLSYGIMHLLHFSIVSWIYAADEPASQGITAVFYGGYYQGTEGLQFWKRNVLMRPTFLYITDTETNDPLGAYA